VASPQTGPTAKVSRGGGSTAKARASTARRRYSLQVRLPAELHVWASDIARSEAQELTEFILRAVQREVDRRIRLGGLDFVLMLEELHQQRPRRQD
jgi:hypothetical protein